MGVRESIRRRTSEEMRILYVALTRARERLYLVGSVSALPESVERWRQQAETVQENRRLPLYLATKVNTCLDWIMPVLSSLDGLVPDCSEHEISTGSVPGWQATLYPAEAVVREFGPSQSSTGDALALEGRDQEQQQSGSVWNPELAAQLQRQITWQYPYAWLSTAGAHDGNGAQAAKMQLETAESAPNKLYIQPTFRRPSFMLDTGKLTPTEWYRHPPGAAAFAPGYRSVPANGDGLH